MLTGLSIRDFVLVRALDLDLGGGFTALTGETGAGKSILMSALGFALGARAGQGLVDSERHGPAAGREVDGEVGGGGLDAGGADPLEEHRPHDRRRRR